MLDDPDDDDGEALGAVCVHVAEQGRPVLAVFRHADDFWSFSCGLPDHPDADSWLGLGPQALADLRAAHPLVARLDRARMAWRDKDGDDVWRIEALPEDD